VTTVSGQDTGPRLNALLVVHADEKRGGVQAVVDTVAGWLEAKGHQVLLFHSGESVWLTNGMTKLGYRGVRLRLCWPFSPLRGVLRTVGFPVVFLFVLVQLLWLLRSRKIQVVNLHYPVDNFIYFAICRRLLGIRLVTSVHGRDAFYKERPLDKYSRAMALIISSSDLVILPSDAYRKMLAEAFPDSRDKIIFIHNAVNPATFTPADGDATQVGSAPYILCIAELQEYKAIDVLLDAARILVEANPHLTLVLAGDGPMRQALEDQATAIGIRHRVLFLGTQGVAELVTLLRGCSVAVLPSRMEPFGIAILEALACRRPVVATAVGGIPEIINHEVNGLLVEPENPAALAEGLRRVLADEALGRKLASNGYSTVMDRFCSPRQGADYERVFASLTENGARPPS
jgi:glycosyltransferase involved in cell wall biosynthesis